MHTLQQGLEIDGFDLTLRDAWRLGERTLVPWTDPTVGQFLPGRLDLTSAFAASLGIDRDMSARTADHLIMVTDLRARPR